MATYRIYSLSDPRDGLVRYVGRTRRTIDDRFLDHLRLGKRHPTLGAWLNELDCLGLCPKRTLLQEHDHRLAEWFWTWEFRKQGHPLLCKQLMIAFPWASIDEAIEAESQPKPPAPPPAQSSESQSAITKRWRKSNRDRAYEQVKRWRAKYPEAYRAIARKSQAKWRAKRKELLAQIASVPKPTVPTEPDPWLSM